MKFVRPVSIIHTAHNLKGGLQLAEFAGRLCYKSESKIEPGSYQKFLFMLMNKGHTSILEHCPIYICGYKNDLGTVANGIIKSSFSRFTTRTDTVTSTNPFYYIYSNLRVVYDFDSDFAKQLVMTSTMEGNDIWKDQGVAWFVPKFNSPFARMSAYITTLRSVVDELVRERVQSDAVESTRWCDYSNEGRFDGISFCLPHWVEDSTFNACFKRFLKDVEAIEKNEDKIQRLYDLEDIAFCLYKNDTDIANKRSYHYIRCCIMDEIFYNEAKDELDLPAQDAREYLFLGIKSEMYYTGFNKEWDNIIDKRLYDKYNKAHPNMHITMQQCKDHLDVIRTSQKTITDSDHGRESESTGD